MTSRNPIRDATAAYLADRRGRRKLGAGAGIEPASLRLRGGVVEWRAADEPRTEPVAG